MREELANSVSKSKGLEFSGTEHKSRNRIAELANSASRGKRQKCTGTEVKNQSKTADSPNRDPSLASFLQSLVISRSQALKLETYSMSRMQPLILMILRQMSK
jgi:hypothetical protein